MRNHVFGTVFAILILLTSASSVGSVQATPQSTHRTLAEDNVVCDLTITPDTVRWEPVFEYASATLVVVGPEHRSTWTFDAGEELVLSVAQAQLQDGLHQYELRFRPILTAETEAAMAALRDSAESAARETEIQGIEPLPVLSGNFRIAGGALVLDTETEQANVDPVENTPSVADSTTQVPQVIAPMDVVHNDDLIVNGGLCVGVDCANGESFNFATLRLKENNTRIVFEDTSSITSYPTTDWTLVANDSANGGQNRFSVEQRDTGDTPFTILDSARNNAIYVKDDLVGLGTSVPWANLEVVDGWTPYIRFHLDTSQGFATYKWDMTANESNFLIIDRTGGGTLPFRLGPGLPTDSLTVKGADGRVGMGTWYPRAKLHVTGSQDSTFIKVENTSGTSDTRTLAHLSNLGAAQIVVENRATGSSWTSTYSNTYTMVYSDTSLSAPVPALQLDSAGNVVINGALVESSDIALKENFASVDGADALNALADLDIQSWNYIADDDSVRHIGPIAQDFYAAFGLGADDKHISPLDANGVTMIAVQELAQQVTAQQQELETQSTRIENLEQENATLEQRLAELEALVATLAAEK